MRCGAILCKGDSLHLRNHLDYIGVVGNMVWISSTQDLQSFFGWGLADLFHMWKPVRFAEEKLDLP